jgi:uncharacterized protein (TIGR02453 family)
MAASPRFTPGTIPFLRSLKRHNDSAWFRAHKDSYEQHVRGPMIAVVERLAGDFGRFAPELVATPKISLFRPYRDTRFSEDKRPLKTHVSAVFPCRELGKKAGAVLYLHVDCERVLIAGGLHAPESAELHRVRAHLAEHYDGWRVLVESPAFRRTFGRIAGDSLQRMPRPFPADHPAATYLKLKELLAARELPAAFCAGPRFYATVVKSFEILAPVVRFLNDPLVAAAAFDPLAVESPVGVCPRLPAPVGV